MCGWQSRSVSLKDMSWARLFAAGLLAAVLASPAAAQQKQYEGPWCAIVVTGWGYASRCDMRSFEMCQREILGQGASHCTQNPYYYAKPEPKPRKRTRVQ